MANPRLMIFYGIIIGSLLVILGSNYLVSPGQNDLSIPRNVTKYTHVTDKEITNRHQTETEPSCSLSLDFPEAVIQYCELITYYAGINDMDPGLVAAVILQESRGNPDAISSSGAVGLMQVMPNDGAASDFMCINGPCFASRPGTMELLDPEINIEYGTTLLAGLISSHGNYRDGLMAYGPENIGYSYADAVMDIYQVYR